MLLVQPPFIVALPVQMKPTKKVLSFIAHGNSQLQLEPLPDLASRNQFGILGQSLDSRTAGESADEPPVSASNSPPRTLATKEEKLSANEEIRMSAKGAPSGMEVVSPNVL